METERKENVLGVKFELVSRQGHAFHFISVRFSLCPPFFFVTIVLEQLSK